MYESHWQLDARPFEPHADHTFYYPAETHQGALLKLRYALENRRHAALMAGEPGTGKTLLLSKLRDLLGKQYQPFVRLVFPQMNTRDLLVYLAENLNAPPDDPPRYTIEESIRRIEFVLSENRRQDQHAVIVIDEAHLLADEDVLETLRLLLNLSTDEATPFTLLLVGQMGLLSKVERMPSLNERLAVKTLIRALSHEETSSYVSHRLKAAGAKQDIFDTSALDEIHILSQGVPRSINRLCDLALLIGYADGKTTLTSEEVAAVSDELVTVSPE